MNQLLYILALSLIVTKGCQKAKTVDFELEQPFSLALEEQAANKAADITISLDSLLEDSRCPKYVNCVWEGIVRLQCTVNGEPVTLQLRPGRQYSEPAFWQNYAIWLSAFDPYPEYDKKTNPKDYRATLMIEAIAEEMDMPKMP